ncbi:MAG: IclR family transcriptional regulator [Bacilli bacterium]|nr:IclR family transcriptional regulator [Bacilli bacterium]
MERSSTTAKIIKIIELLYRHPAGLTLAEITKIIRYPKTTIYDIVTTLVDYDFLVIKNSRLKNYAIGPKLYIYGSAYLESSNLLNVSQTYLNNLADKYHKTGMILKTSKGSVVCVYKYESPTTKVRTKSIGEKIPLYASAAGKVALAFDEMTRNSFDFSEMKAYTSQTICDPLLLGEVINKARAYCYATENCEYEPYITAVASPILDYQNILAGIICLIGLYDENEDLEELGRILEQESRIISNHLGYVENE